jgi:1A family penicillin-binding protein
MARQGRYSKRKSPLDRIRWSVKRRWRWFKRLSKPKKALLLGGPILAFLIVTPLVTYIYYYNDIADQDRLMNRNNTGIVLKDKNGTAFYELGTAGHRDVVNLDQISDSTEHALIASEDKDFYKHGGFSIMRIAGSVYGNILAGDATAYGGSTLTQQLAKTTLLSSNKTFLRKYQELTIATAIEQRYSKDQILAMYLNSAYFGNNSFGIEEAAKNYFGKKASDLTLAESSMLIGVLPAPSAYSPIGGSMEYAKERQNTVLKRMVTNGYITQAEKDAAASEALAYQPAQGINNVAPHFTEMVLEELYEKYGEETVKRSGYQVTTSLDMTMQNAALAGIDSNIAHIQQNGGSNASVVAVDPVTGQIRALVGSADYNNEQFGKVNMAVTKRQPGSSFKPIYYAKALADGDITPVTVLKDEKTDFNGYAPQNATKRFYGNVTVRKALDWSLNIPAVKVLQRVGISSALDQAKALGVTTLGSASDYGLSLALGAGEIPLTEMTGAYATFANAGEHHDLTTVTSIQNKYSKTIFTASQTPKRAISAEGAYLISDILSDNATRGSFFGSTLNVTGTDFKTKKVAVKTGTTDDSRDAWTVGYTPELAVGVWVGNNDNTVMSSGGADMAGPIWRAIMKVGIGSSEPAFAQPSGITKATVCTTAGTFTDVFLSSNVPSSTCATESSAPAVKQPEKEEETSTPTTPTTPTTTTPDTPTSPQTPTTGTGGTATGGSGTTTPGTGTGGTGGVTIPTPTTP